MAKSRRAHASRLAGSDVGQRKVPCVLLFGIASDELPAMSRERSVDLMNQRRPRVRSAAGREEARNASCFGQDTQTWVVGAGSRLAFDRSAGGSCAGVIRTSGSALVGVA